MLNTSDFILNILLLLSIVIFIAVTCYLFYAERKCLKSYIEIEEENEKLKEKNEKLKEEIEKLKS